MSRACAASTNQIVAHHAGYRPRRASIRRSGAGGNDISHACGASNPAAAEPLQIGHVGSARGLPFAHISVLVRTSRSSDAEALAAIVTAGWRSAYREIFDESRLDSDDFAVERLARWRENAQDLDREDADPAILVAEDNGTVVGWCSFGRPRELAANQVGEIWGLYVTPTAWGTSTAHALHAAAIDALRERGFGELRLWVLAANPRARRFYEKEGWDLTGAMRERDFGAVGSAVEVEMAMPL